MNRLALILCCTLALTAQAQDVPDASAVPDASVGEGGADQTSEENDPNPTCLDSSTCDQRTACVNGRCIPVKTRSIGCGAVPFAPLALLALLGALKRRAGR